ncbi:hypothetical protein ABZ697_30865 [Streptomyces albidoflavus]|uniref:hypothetical protein n=1 Tax=Streptomyces albidoflavus TaxID=1886 RepID=UPI003410835E
MHSITHLTASPPTEGTVGAPIVIVLFVLGWAAIKLRRPRSEAHAIARAMRPGGGIVGFFKAVGAFFKGTWTVLRFLGRLVSGLELNGQRKSTATFWEPGKPLTARPERRQERIDLESLAPRISLIKKEAPTARPWARKAATWVHRYDGKAAGALDAALRLTLALTRAVKAVVRRLQCVYRVVAPVVATLARTAASWSCWPYSARAAARLALLAAALGLATPAWRTITLIALGAALVLAVFLACRFQPAPPTDADLYTDRLWAILRTDLKLPEDTLPDQWLRLPARLADPTARITLRLPVTFRGSELERQQVTDLINSRLPGEWVSRWHFTTEHYVATWRPKPPAPVKAPEPECPDLVDFFDPEIQAAIANCKKGEIVVGRDAHNRIVVKEMGDSETPHWALSVGSGGGKSAFSQMVIAQLIAQGYHIMAADVKRVSVSVYKNVPGVHLYNDPNSPQDMRALIEWFKDEIDARSAIKEKNPHADFPGILLLIEESNEFADISREWWDDNRKARADEFGPAERAADPIWGTVASAARLGRFVHGNILAVFQDMRDQALGGKGLRNLFRLKLMGNYSQNSWKNVVGTTPVPDSVDKAGRMMVVEGNHKYWVQTCYAKPEALAAWAAEQRKKQDFDPAAGLFGAPPEPSPTRLPHLLERLSRDDERLRHLTALEGGLGGETAGELSHHEGNVTAQEADVTASRDTFRLIPGQGGEQTAQDPTAPPELLPLAEIARRLEDVPEVPTADTMRAHKKRRGDDFPQGITQGKKELYTVDQIHAYYLKEAKGA